MNVERIRELLDYNHKTGELRWKQTRGPANSGTIAGTITRGGYRRLSVDYQLLLAHRVAWVITHGEMPPKGIDHINGVQDDNRLENLRPASQTTNSQNARMSINNTSGCLGLTWDKARNKWFSQIMVKGKTISLGRHDEWFDAVCARKAAEYQHGFHTNHGRVV